MAYVRKKKMREKTVYQLVEGYRERSSGRVRQRVLAHLGNHKTPERALRYWPARILRLRHVAHDARKRTEQTAGFMRKAVRGEEIGGWNERIAPEEAREGAMYRQKAVARYMDEDGNMKRLKHAPHTIKEMRYRGRVLGRDSIHDMYLDWNTEYWHYIDHAEMLEREADRLEERYVKLYEINGGDPEEARRLLRDRFRRLLDAHERRSKWHEAKRAKEQALWLESRGLANADSIAALGVLLHGPRAGAKTANTMGTGEG